MRFLGVALTPYCEYEMLADEKNTDIIVSIILYHLGSIIYMYDTTTELY